MNLRLELFDIVSAKMVPNTILSSVSRQLKIEFSAHDLALAVPLAKHGGRERPMGPPEAIHHTNGGDHLHVLRNELHHTNSFSLQYLSNYRPSLHVRLRPR